MTNAWTPGPWQMSGGRQRIDGEECHTVGPDKGWVAAVPYSDKTDAQHLQSLADARLIAAAPMGADLAECVLQNANDCPKAVIDRAVAFLAKAGGE